MSKKLVRSEIHKRLNSVKGFTVMGVVADATGFTITFMDPDGNETTLTPADILNVSPKATKELITFTRIVTLKHADSCEELSINVDKVFGAVVGGVSLYANGKGVHSKRLTIVFQLTVPDTKLTPAIIATIDLSDKCELQ